MIIYAGDQEPERRGGSPGVEEEEEDEWSIMTQQHCLNFYLFEIVAFLL